MQAMESSASASLVTIPPELLDQITDYLSDETLSTLRRTCKTLHAAVFDRYCDTYFAHLGCWMLSKCRWERIHNLLAASSVPVSHKVKTITFTLDELEFRTSKDFAVVPSEREA